MLCKDLKQHGVFGQWQGVWNGRNTGCKWERSWADMLGVERERLWVPGPSSGWWLLQVMGSPSGSRHVNMLPCLLLAQGCREDATSSSFIAEMLRSGASTSRTFSFPVGRSAARRRWLTGWAPRRPSPPRTWASFSSLGFLWANSLRSTTDTVFSSSFFFSLKKWFSDNLNQIISFLHSASVLNGKSCLKGNSCIFQY